MLVVDRKLQQRVLIRGAGFRVWLSVCQIRSNRVKLGFEASQTINVVREEIVDAEPTREIDRSFELQLPQRFRYRLNTTDVYGCCFPTDTGWRAILDCGRILGEFHVDPFAVMPREVGELEWFDQRVDAGDWPNKRTADNSIIEGLYRNEAANREGDK